MRRLSARLATAAAMGWFAFTGAAANAGNVVVEFSGTFGTFDYGNQPAPLNDGSFYGTATFASLPSPNTQVISETADVNFYNSSGQLVFTVGGSGSYDTLTAGASGYTKLSISGDAHVGSSTVDVAPLGLEFSSWAFGSPTGIVKPYGAPDYFSAIEYTYTPGSTTYFNPVLTGQATVPEPSTLALSLIGMAGTLVYARCRRRGATA